MAVTNIDKEIGFYKNTSEFTISVGPDTTHDFKLKNDGPAMASGVELAITIPTGLELKTGASSVSKGTFDEGTAVWSVGTLLTTDEPEAAFVFTVTDSCERPFQVNFDLTSNACDCDLNDNQICITLLGVSCCDIQDCNETTNSETIYAVPITAFADTSRPTLEEVKTWADANVPTLEQDNGTILTYTREAFTRTDSYSDVSVQLTNAGLAEANIRIFKININGTDYAQEFPASSDAAFDEVAFKAFVEASMVTAGVTGTVVITEDIDLSSTIDVDITTQTGIFNFQVYTKSDVTDPLEIVSAFKLDLLSNNKGSKSPDYIWVLNKDGVGTYSVTEVHKSTDLGDILYVTIDGNDDTGERGNPNKPFETYEGALLDFMPGDIIRFSEGAYAPLPARRTPVGVDGSPGSLTLDFDLNSIFTVDNSGTNLHFLTTNTNAFEVGGSSEINILSNGIINTTIDETYAGFFAAGLDERVVVKAKEITVNSGRLARGLGTGVQVEADKLTVLTTEQAVIHYHVNNPAADRIIESIFKVGKVIVNANPVAVQPGAVGLVAFTAKDTADQSVKRIEIDDLLVLDANDYTALVVQTQNNPSYAEIDVRVKNTDFNVTNITTETDYFDNYPAGISGLLSWDLEGGMVDSSINIDLGTVKSNGSIGKISGLTLTNTYMYINIGNADVTEIGLYLANMILVNSTIIVEANITSVNRPALCLKGTSIDGNSKIVIRGRYETAAAVPAVTVSSQCSNRIIFEDCTLINDGSVAALEANGATNILIRNVVTNVPLGNADADVTEVGQAIIRDTNYI